MGERGREPIFNLPAVVVFSWRFLPLFRRARVVFARTDLRAIIATFGFMPARFSFLLDQSAVTRPSDEDRPFIGGPGPDRRVFPDLRAPRQTLVYSAELRVPAWRLDTSVFNGILARRLRFAGGPAIWGRALFILGALGAIAGAFFYTALHLSELAPMIGASAAVSAYMGAAARFVFPIRRVFS